MTQPALVFVEAPIVRSRSAITRLPEGSRLVHFTIGQPSKTAKNLTSELFAATDPAVTFNGLEIYFSGKKRRASNWQIWAMNQDGSNLHSITDCSGDCMHPVLLPRHRIAYTQFSQMDGRISSAVYVAHDDGSDAHPITFGPGDFGAETILPDGRLVISANDPLASCEPGQGSRALYLINPDGSGLRRLETFPRDRNGSLDSVQAGRAQALDDGSIVFLRTVDDKGAEPARSLAWIRHGRLQSERLTKPPAVYASAHELGGDSLVVAAKLSPRRTAPYALYNFDLASGSLGQLIYQNPKASSFDAVPLEPSAAPRIYWSILHTGMKTGRILCINAYLSEDFPAGRVPTNIADVRVLGLDAQTGRTKAIGTAPVEKDGSFYLTVPANFPVRFELLNARGATIHAQQSWIWTRPGEDRTCLGCHESPAQTPSDHWPLAVKSNKGPTPLAWSVTPRPAH